MAQVIGIDLGNCYSFPSYIPQEDLDENRLGGKPKDLIPPNNKQGYPSVFFYSQEAARKSRSFHTAPPPWCGVNAVRQSATPIRNRIRYLKRHIGEPLTLDDWEGTYDEALTAVIQDVVRMANEIMHQDILETTNLIALAYPAAKGFTRAKCQRLKELAEKATLADGRHIQVVGMIAEPAAAALDYLVAMNMTNDTTALVYDLGGGTFDDAIVKVYPRGKTGANGQRYYYDIETVGGLEIGGGDFDQIMFRLLKSKLSSDQRVADDYLMRHAEDSKIALTTDEYTTVDAFALNGEPVQLTVTREEFERASQSLIGQTVQEVLRMMNESLTTRPDIILLTGGASQMPMVKKALEAALPAYKGKICIYRPSYSISYGTARFGPSTQIVQRRLPHDLGIVFNDTATDRLKVSTYLKKGTPLPCHSEWIRSYVHGEGSTESVFTVYEAKETTYDPFEVRRDFNRVYEITLNYPPAAHETPHESMLSINEMGLLTVTARDPQDPNVHIEDTIQLNLKE